MVGSEDYCHEFSIRPNVKYGQNNGPKIFFVEDYVTVNLTFDLFDIKYNYFIILSYYT